MNTPHAGSNGNMRRLLQLMSDKGASDLYLSAHSRPLLRIDGVCTPVSKQRLHIEAPLGLLREIVSESDLQRLQSSHELNIGYLMSDTEHFHINVMRQRSTFAVTIRRTANHIPSLSSLLLPPVLGDLALEKHGLILMVGTAESGKDTTLASMIEHRNANASGHILIIEESMGYLFQNKCSVVNQREIGVDTESLQTALKSALHQAPDVIVIGEIHNRETALAALSCARSGRLCLAHLNTSNSFEALTRLVNFFPADLHKNILNDLADSLRAVISQRQLRTINNELTPIVEIIINTPSVSGMLKRVNLPGIVDDIKKASNNGSQTFEQDIARLILAGIVEHKEGMANAESPSNLVWHLQNNLKDQEKNGAAGQDDQPVFTEVTFSIQR